MPITNFDRLRSMLHIHATTKNSDKCLKWPFANTGGETPYGAVWHDGKMRRVHVVSLELKIGKLPEGMHALHHCDNPICFNQKHLFCGTHADNMRDCSIKNRANKPRGENHGASRLVEAQIKELREMYTSGISTRKLGILFNVSWHTAWNIATRRTWRHVP